MWIGRGLSSQSLILHGSPTISEIKLNSHQDFVASTHRDFFQRQIYRGQFFWPNHSAETRLSK